MLIFANTVCTKKRMADLWLLTQKGVFMDVKVVQKFVQQEQLSMLVTSMEAQVQDVAVVVGVKTYYNRKEDN